MQSLNTLQMPSAAVGEVKEISEQPVSSTPPIVHQKEKQTEEKDETSEKEESAIQILVALPKSSTPIQTLQQPSTDSQTLQIRTPGSSSSRVVRKLHYGVPQLDEEIKIPYYESSTLTEEKINEIQSALDRRRRQEALRKEHKNRHALNEIKDIFMDGFCLQSPDESRPIIEQLSNIVDQVTSQD